MKKVTTAIFPVGGLGTRFLPATKSMPKEMLPIANKPIVQYAFEEARDAGIEKFIFITGRNKAAINNHFDHAYELESSLDKNHKSEELRKVLSFMPQAGQIAFIRQQKPLGLGHAILCAKDFVSENEAFVVILPDEMMALSKDPKKNFLSKMMDFYKSEKNARGVVAVDSVDPKEVSKYGIIKTENQKNDEGKILDMVEKPAPEVAPSNLAITGRYVLEYKIFDYLSKCNAGSGGEIQLTDAMKAMCKDYDFYYKKIDEERFDCGNVLGYIEANIAFALNDQKIAADVKKIIKKYASN